MEMACKFNLILHKDKLTKTTKRVKGNSGVSATAQRMVAQYRDNIRAIDREIIEKLNKHFMAIY